MEVKIHKCNGDNNTSYLWHSLLNKALSNILSHLLLPQCFGKKGCGSPDWASSHSFPLLSDDISLQYGTYQGNI